MSILLPISSTPHRCGALLFSSLGRALFLLQLIQLFPACSFYRSEVSLEVRLPAAPRHWHETFGELSFRILYPAGYSGAFEEKRADSSTCVVIQIPKILHLPVLAYPYLPGKPIELPPSGGVYPLDCDMPKINTVIVESMDPDRPYGAKEAGMSIAMSAAQAYVAAVSNAIGVYLDDYPITPDRVLKAIEEKKRSEQE